MSELSPTQTRDKFLDGRLLLRQPLHGYRAGIDPVLLASFVCAAPGESVLDLGCGVGAAALCLGTRVAGLRLTGVERQQKYADLARQNARENKIAMTVYQCDLACMPSEVRRTSFDHVIMNPPYYDRSRGSHSPNEPREQALGEDTPLKTWVDQAARRLKPRGYLTAVLLAERLPSLLEAVDGRLGSVLVKPLSPRIGRAAKLVLFQARKGGRGGFRLAAPLVLHKGEEHEKDHEHYTEEVSAVVRDGHALPQW